jgi:UDP-N-acetylmuramate dehydrogenase
VAKGADAYPPVVLGGCFDVVPASAEDLKSLARRAAKARSASQPGYRGSAGCFFKNPSTENPAGRLIEQAGLKGRQCGGAVVSEKHANFILNTGRATADDIMGLMKTVQAAVYDKFGILLEPEVRIIGEEKGSEK